MSVRFSSAALTAASVSTGRGSKTAGVVGSISMLQKSGAFGSNTSVRSRSAARSTLAPATITASSRRATSACASTMSIGAMVPISTRERLLRSDSRARSSDWRATSSEPFVYFRSMYALLTARMVDRIVWRSEMSETSRFFLLITSCVRAPSTLKLRMKGCVKLNVRVEPRAGFGLSYTLFELARVLPQVAV